MQRQKAAEGLQGHRETCTKTLMTPMPEGEGNGEGFLEEVANELVLERGADSLLCLRGNGRGDNRHTENPDIRQEDPEEGESGQGMASSGMGRPKAEIANSTRRKESSETQLGLYEAGPTERSLTTCAG